MLPTHVVVIVQENRSFDNLFNGFPGADTAREGLNSSGQKVQLQPVALDAKFDLGHAYPHFVADYDNGRMDGWDKTPILCAPSGCPPVRTVYGYVPPQQVAPYWSLAKEFALGDHVFQTSEGSSFPAHQYLIAGQSGGYDADHLAMADSPNSWTGGCNALHVLVQTIDTTQPFPATEGHPIFPCLDYQTIFDLLAAKGLSWRYYTPGFSSWIWTAPMAIQHIWNSPPAAQNVVSPETQILTDIANHQLPSVSYVVPEVSLSDHSGYCTLAGPDWVGTVVNAIGTNPYYWKNTTVLVVWDEWGGWFDHYVTHHPSDYPTDPYEYGFRVPLIAISAYAKPGFVDHTPRDYSAILGFIEHVFRLPSLRTRDATTDDLFSMFQFTSLSPLQYKPVDTNGYKPSSFLHRTIDSRPVDD